MQKWVADNVTLERNPEICEEVDDKDVTYFKTTNNKTIRVGSKSDVAEIRVSWRRLPAKWKNWLYKLHADDTEFNIYTNFEDTEYEDVTGGGGDIPNIIDSGWVVTIDNFNARWRERNASNEDLFDVDLTLKRFGFVDREEEGSGEGE